jgi:hypothetical protein
MTIIKVINTKATIVTESTMSDFDNAKNIVKYD